MNILAYLRATVKKATWDAQGSAGPRHAAAGRRKGGSAQGALSDYSPNPISEGLLRTQQSILEMCKCAKMFRMERIILGGKLMLQMAIPFRGRAIKNTQANK